LLQVPETLVVLETTIQLTAEVPDAPSAEGQNDDAELMAPVGKGIRGSRGVIAVELATYEAMCLKCFQTIREHIGRHAGQTFLKVLKPHCAGEKVTDDQQRPTGTHDIKRPRHRTRRIKTILRHFESNHLVRCKSITGQKFALLIYSQYFFDWNTPMTGFPDHQALLASPGSGSVAWESATSAEVQQPRPSSVSVAGSNRPYGGRGQPSAMPVRAKRLVANIGLACIRWEMYQQS
jgi:hypothetical protein